MPPLNIQYYFRMPDGREEVFDLRFDARTLDLQTPTPTQWPEWTRLEFRQCPHCPLTPDAAPRCPLAAHLIDLVDKFLRLISYDRLHIEIVTPERRVVQETTAQRGISSMMGLIMATSGCPHMAFLKPMARFHQPLADREHTIYRAAAMYMLAQYFLHQAGQPADLTMTGLAQRYRNVQTVNIAMAERLRAATDQDAVINAVVLLDQYAKSLPNAVRDGLKDIRHLFEPYLSAPPIVENPEAAPGERDPPEWP